MLLEEAGYKVRAYPAAEGLLARHQSRARLRSQRCPDARYGWLDPIAAPAIRWICAAADPDHGSWRHRNGG